jgi:exodeoxyribonuclease VII large subunit
VTGRPAPTQYGDRAVYPVSEFNRGVAGWIDRLPRVWVEGEVSELKRNDRWALAYLTLKDLSDGSLLPAFIGRTRLDAISPPIQEGERVHVHGRGQIYRARGTFAFEVTALERFGLGQLLRAIEELRTRLAAEGLFDAARKRPLPFLPGTIGLICGSDAAAKRDVVETAAERYPPARFRIREVAVQGTAAVGQIVAAVKLLDRDPAIDVIVLARGGGSFEDLLPFSDERVVRAVAEAATPVVSAIGHEQDVPLVDLAADVRAGTPSLAAKLVVPDHAAEAAALDSLLVRGATGLANGAARARERLTALAARPAFADPTTWIAVRRHTLVLQRDYLDRYPVARLERERTRLTAARDRLRLLGPAATLERGYAVVLDEDGRVLRDSADTAAGRPIAVRLSRGRLAARVEEVSE